MARTGDTQAGTQGQWFINTKDNTTNLGQANSGGYAVFGWVVGSGMSVVDAIAAVPTFSYTSPFNQIPLTNFTQADFNNGNPALPHVVVLASATVVNPQSGSCMSGHTAFVAHAQRRIQRGASSMRRGVCGSGRLRRNHRPPPKK